MRKNSANPSDNISQVFTIENHSSESSVCGSSDHGNGRNVKSGGFDKKSHERHVEDRGNWGTKTEYILSCLGYCVGMGNVWRFPYLCYRNGGGAFLVPYIIMLFFCGVPLYFMETCWGQFANTGCMTMFKLAPLFKGAGYAIIVLNIICNTYYNVIISYPLLFLAKSIRWELPWEHCNNTWNTDKCLKLDGSNVSRATYLNNAYLNLSERYKTPADEFFHNEILEISPGIDQPNGIVWPLFFCDMLSWLLLYMCIRNGVKSVGKVVYFTATFPFIILGILLVRGITLPGAMDGIKFYITPQWDNLFNLRVWADASIQIFFSLGPGWGGIVNMASFNKFRNDTQADSIVIPIVNVMTSIFAGFVVFSVLGYMSERTGLPVSSVATGGPGLAFITYPEAIAMLPVPQLWAALFFIMLYLLGMDSCFVQIEAIVSSVLDEWPKLRPRKQLISFGVIFVMFLASICCVTRGGMYLVQLFDWYSASISIISVCLVEIFIVGWVYGVDNFVRDIEFMIEKKLNPIWKFAWKYVTPGILLFIFLTSIIYNNEVTYNNQKYPRWAIIFGWSTCGISIVCIPLYMVYRLAIEKGTLSERIRKTTRFRDWGPSDPETRRSYQELLKRTKNDKMLKKEMTYGY